jgi:O-antigen ligase
MSNIKDLNPTTASLKIKSKFFFVAVLFVLGLGRTWGLMDEYLLGRFLMLSIILIGAYLFVVPHRDGIRINGLDLAFMAYLMISYASLCWAHIVSAGLLTVQTTFLSLAFYFGFRLLKKDTISGFVLNGLKWLTVLTLAIFFVQLIRLGATKGINNDNIYEVTGMSAHKNLLASFLFLLFGFNAYQACSSKSNKWLFVLMGIQLLAIFLLRSRATLLAFLISGSIMLGYTILPKILHQSIPWRRLIPIVLGGMVLSLILFFSLGGTKQNLISLSPTEYRKSASGTERLFVWYKTRLLIKDKWLSGYGAGNWKIIFPSKSIGGAYRLQSQDVTMTRAHNDYLEIWAELGIFGLIAYLAIFIISIFGITYAFFRSDHETKTNLVVLAGVMIGYMIIAYFDFPKERMEHQVLFSLLIAYVVATIDGHNLRPDVSWLLSPRITKYIVAAMIAFLLFNVYLSYHQMKGEYHTRKALVAQARAIWPLVESESRMAYSPFYQINPSASSMKWLEGLGQYHQGNFELALKSLSTACHHTPYHFRTLNDYASCLVQLKRYDEAINVYKKVLFINPRLDDAMFNISYAYAQVKDYDQAMYWVRNTKTLPEKKESFIQEIEKLKLNH